VFPLLGMTLPEFAKQKLPANVPVPGGGHDHGESVAIPTAQAHRDFIAVVSESLANECQEPRQMVRMVDITFESTPVGVSTWTVPEASGNFCSRGGRFGSHSSQESFTPIYYGRVLFVTFFNAGLRALDIRDPFNIKEIGYNIAEAPTSGARWRFSPTTWRLTIAGTSTLPIARTRGCTSSSSPARRGKSRISRLSNAGSKEQDPAYGRRTRPGPHRDFRNSTRSAF